MYNCHTILSQFNYTQHLHVIYSPNSISSLLCYKRKIPEGPITIAKIALVIYLFLGTPKYYCFEKVTIER